MKPCSYHLLHKGVDRSVNHKKPQMSVIRPERAYEWSLPLDNAFLRIILCLSVITLKLPQHKGVQLMTQICVLLSIIWQEIFTILRRHPAMLEGIHSRQGYRASYDTRIDNVPFFETKVWVSIIKNVLTENTFDTILVKILLASRLWHTHASIWSRCIYVHTTGCVWF